jgi:O-antigen/teichoic acid export membrane protein
MKSARSLLQNAAVYSSANILNAAIPFLLLPILTRVLLPADYGVLAMFNATLGILGAFTGLSVHGAISVRFVDRENIDFPRYVGSCLCVLLLSTLATLGVVSLLLKPLSEFTAVPPLWLLLAVIVSSCNFLIQVRLGIWLMAKKTIAYGAFQLSLSLLNMGLSLFFVILLQLSYEGRLLGQLIAVAVFACIGLLSLSTSGWVKFRPSWLYMREALDFGLPLVPHVIGGFLVAVADRFIIKQQIGLEAAGIYMVAVQLGLGMGLLADAFNKAFVPWLYEQLKADSLEIKRHIVKGTWGYFCVALVIAGLVALLSYWIILFVAGPEYIGASSALAWIALGQAFGGMYLMVTNYIFYKRKTKVLAWATLFSGGIGVLLTWVLTPVIGITGAGLSFAIAMCLRFFLTWFLSQRVCPMPWFFFCR